MSATPTSAAFPSGTRDCDKVCISCQRSMNTQNGSERTAAQLQASCCCQFPEKMSFFPLRMSISGNHDFCQKLSRAHDCSRSHPLPKTRTASRGTDDREQNACKTDDRREFKTKRRLPAM